MRLQRLWLHQFRSYEEAEVAFDGGVTALVGPNGAGKTNLLEAISYLATLSSFRGASVDALVRQAAVEAALRASVERDGRELLIEASLRPGGRRRVQVNRQRLQRARDLLGALRVTLFTPDDLVLVKGGPSERRRYLDETLVARHPRHDVVRTEVDRVLKQRNALLKQARGSLDAAAASTLAVWDTKLAEAGEALGAAREELVGALGPVLVDAYDSIAGVPSDLSIAYRRSWGPGGLGEALTASREEDLRRGVTLVGPHRDELELRLAELPARTHASQGEQRSLALALRLAAHAVVRAAASVEPVLLLDDIFSELDPERSEALVAHLPQAQTILTTAGRLPPGIHVDLVLRIADGKVVPEG